MDLCELEANLVYKSEFQDRLQSYMKKLCVKKLKKKKENGKTINVHY